MDSKTTELEGKVKTLTEEVAKLTRRLTLLPNASTVWRADRYTLVETPRTPVETSAGLVETPAGPVETPRDL